MIYWWIYTISRSVSSLYKCFCCSFSRQKWPFMKDFPFDTSGSVNQSPVFSVTSLPSMQDLTEHLIWLAITQAIRNSWFLQASLLVLHLSPLHLTESISGSRKCLDAVELPFLICLFNSVINSKGGSGWHQEQAVPIIPFLSRWCLSQFLQGQGQGQGCETQPGTESR